MDCPRDVARSRAVFGWAVTGFVLLQLAFTAVVDVWFPLFYDREAAERNRQLCACLKEKPGRPVLLLMGSSRTTMSFRPDMVGPLQDNSGKEVLVFNYSHIGATTPYHFLQLRRLVRQGIKPDWLVLELLPPFLASDSNTLLIHGSVATELAITAHYVSLGKLVPRYLAKQVLPWFRNRTMLLLNLAPDWLAPNNFERELTSLGPMGWDPRFWDRQFNAQEIRRRTDIIKADYEPRLRHFEINPRPARALYEILDLCRREQIKVVLVMTPESKEFRSWYAPDTLSRLTRFCDELSAATGVPVIDARNWLPDEEFYDGHHVLPCGADHFTMCLEREVLRPLVTLGPESVQNIPAGTTH
jgi:hypothetical protein